MARILSYPFRLGPGGDVVTVDQDSAQAETEQLAVLILTRHGERALVPDFGLPDPVFRGVQPSELVGQISRWGPPVRLTAVTVEAAGAAAATVHVTFA